MIAEILITGEEILTGAAVDTNSAHIAGALEDAGLEVLRHSSVGDDIGKLAVAMTEISGRADIAVVTGGLGPTQDDVTTEAAARVAGVELYLDQAALDAVEKAFKTRRRVMTASNCKQALLPQGSECLHNPVGTAPGFQLKIGRCMFFFLPGVPYEMQQMLSGKVMPRIEGIQGKSKEKSVVKTLALFGLTESATGERLEEFEARFPDLKLGMRAKFPEIQVKIYGRRRDENQLQQQMQTASEWVLEKLGQYVFSVDGEAMEVVIGDLLGQRQATLAVAESCTGGLISHWRAVPAIFYYQE
jgi:nicotinamide-nucleotide amidase